jgi:hypothetical protein
LADGSIGNVTYNAGKMPKDKVQKLEDAFFVWNALGAKSLERYEELVQYVNEHGNAWVPWFLGGTRIIQH